MPFHGLLAVLVALAIGAAASAWLWLDRRRRDEADAGLAALGAMRWREFSRFVLDAMRHRGYDVEADDRILAGAQQTDVVLRRGDRRWLLASRHGTDARVDTRMVRAMENALLANGATGGIIVTAGVVEPAARKAIAAQPKLELASGRRLWRELKPMLPETLRDEASAAARERAVGRIRLAWLAAAAVGVVVWLVARPESGAVVAPPPAAPVPAEAAVPAPATSPQPAPALPAQEAAAPPPAPVAPDAAQLALDRSQVALAVAALPGVANAAWVTDSTLLVDLRSDADERLPEICEILEQYEALRASRLQLQPAPGSDQRVRFRQCRVF